MNRKAPTRLLVLSAPFAAALIYFLAAAVVFDFSETAYPYDEDHYAGQPVALGPRPRLPFCRRAHDGVNFEGREWPFVVFAPICSLWRARHGYAPAAEWR